MCCARDFVYVYNSKIKFTLSYSLLYQLSTSVSPVQIGPVAPESSWNKHTDRQNL